MGGPAAADELCTAARQGALLFSDSMPWKTSGTGEDTLFLPRPLLLSRKAAPHDRMKAMKKRNWLPILMMDAFLSSVSGTGEIDPKEIPADFGKAGVIERVAAARTEGADAEPYPVGYYQFYTECGLYFLALVRDRELESRLRTLIEGLGLSGIGGKAASGYGKFVLKRAVDLETDRGAQAQWLRDTLKRADRSRQLLLTASLPRPEEMRDSLDGGCFQMIRRAGFVQPASTEQRGSKKRTQYYVAAGSVLRRRFSGDVYAVGGTETQPVMRYGRPLFLGLPQE